MIKIHYNALLPCTAEHVFHVINDVEAYPQFVDTCANARIIRQSADEMEVQLVLVAAGMRYEVITRNRLVATEQITMDIVKGPFTQWYGCWRIKSLSAAACKLTLTLHFALESKLLSISSKTLIEPLMRRFVDALVMRAKQYG